MLITTGQVHNGAIKVDKTFPDGSRVTILVHEGDETFEVTSEQESELMAAIAEADRGDSLSASQVIEELRTL